MNQRLAAAARTLLRNCNKDMNAKEQATFILRSADSVMFGAESLERAAKAVHDETSQYFSGEGIDSKDALMIVHAVVSALKDDA